MTQYLGSLNNNILSGMGYMRPRRLPPPYTLASFFLYFFTLAIIPAITEETTYRAVAGSVAEKEKGKSDLKKILLLAAVFSLAQADISRTLYTFAAGAVFGFLYVRTKSIIPSVIAHFSAAFLSIYFDYSYRLGWFGGYHHRLILGGNTLYFGTVTALAAIGLLATLAFLPKIKKPQEAEEAPQSVPSAEARRDDVKEQDRKKIRSRDKVFFWCALMLGGGATLVSLIGGFL